MAKLGDALHGKLSKAGLTTARQRATLAAFIDGYIESRTDVKPNTRRHYCDARKSMVKFFGADRELSSITPGDADDYRRWLSKAMGDNSIRRRCGRAKQFFRAALRKRLIQENPFGDMKDCSVKANKDRDYFVTRDEATKVLAACPDSQWRLIFALSRFGGLRCPSEHLGLTWADVNWADNRMTVRSPKTEHHDGGQSRVVPIFPELRPHLEASFDEAEPGTVHVISRYRDCNANLRTQLLRIIDRAGLTPWPKLFQNLRASRATELTADFPAHVAAAWLGHSTVIAQKHYWQVTDDDFAKAAEGVRQNVRHRAPEIGRNTLQAPKPRNAETPVLQGFASDCNLVQTCLVPPQGLEP